MIDSLTSINHVDFRQRYNHTYGFFLHGNRKILVFVNSVNDNQAEFVDMNKTPYVVYRDSGYQFEFIPINRGWFNTKNGLFYLARVPARQWSRGISASNTSSYRYDPTTGLRDWTLREAVHSVFEHPISVEEAFSEYVKNQRPGVALSKHFVLTPNDFYFDNKIIGKVSKADDKYLITLTYRDVLQEVQDAIRRSGVSGVSVEVK